ncbi:MAG: nuclear transport factor 2 family protein [Albidovulum sp.]
MTKLEFLTDWYQRVWIDADLDAIDAYFSPSVGADGIMPDGQASAEDFRALIPAIRALVRDLRIVIDHSQEAGDWIWAQITVTARTAHGIEPIKANGQVMVRIEGGRITAAYNCFDFITFFQQAGLLPPDAFMLLLSGEKLG